VLAATSSEERAISAGSCHASVGYAFLNADVVDATAYSSEPISIVVGLDLKGRIIGAKLVEHHESIVLVGIAESEVVHFIDGYVSRNVLDRDADSGTPADIVSGATVSMMVIGDSIMRSAMKVARLARDRRCRCRACGRAPPTDIITAPWTWHCPM
jgi:transcriptional regulator of nitric oxide reductase